MRATARTFVMSLYRTIDIYIKEDETMKNLFYDMYLEIKGRYLVWEAKRALEKWREADDALRRQIEEEVERRKEAEREAEEKYNYM